jgi:hypothetical protein
VKEEVELRVREAYAGLVFGAEDGVHLGSTVRKVTLRTDDPRFHRACEVNREFHARTPSEYFFGGFRYLRHYTASELRDARLFSLWSRFSLPSCGEEFGTVYDESTACTLCGAGATQASPLRLNLRRIPATTDYVRTMADELIVSQRFADMIVKPSLTGIHLAPVEHSGRETAGPVDLHAVPAGRALLTEAERAGCPHPTWPFYVWLNRPEQDGAFRTASEEFAHLTKRASPIIRNPPRLWYQLRFVGPEANVSPPTLSGSDPSDHDLEGEYRCPAGHVHGINLLTEVSVEAASWGGQDLSATRGLFGTRRGLLRPYPVILATPRFRDHAIATGLNGLKFEVAHLVS